jgi:hypothetical protein
MLIKASTYKLILGFKWIYNLLQNPNNNAIKILSKYRLVGFLNGFVRVDRQTIY